MKAVAFRAGLAARALFCLLTLVSGSAQAQSPAPPNPYNGWDNAYYQILAESLRRAGHGKWVYTSDGYSIGRIVDVRTTPDGMHEAAVVRVRRLMGGGQVALPFHRMARLNGRLVAKEDRAAVLTMDRLDAPAGGPHR